jgi:hypothetical protein
VEHELKVCKVAELQQSSRIAKVVHRVSAKKHSTIVEETTGENSNRRIRNK